MQDFEITYAGLKDFVDTAVKKKAVKVSLNEDYVFNSSRDSINLGLIFGEWLHEYTEKEALKVSSMFRNIEERINKLGFRIFHTFKQEIPYSETGFTDPDIHVFVRELAGRIVLQIDWEDPKEGKNTASFMRAESTKEYPNDRVFGLNSLLGSINSLRNAVRILYKWTPKENAWRSVDYCSYLNKEKEVDFAIVKAMQAK